MLFKKYLLTREDTRTHNAQTMDRAAGMLENEGRLVSIFPTGGVYNAATTPWRTGVGQLAASLSPETFDCTMVAPFMFDGVNPRRILQAIIKSRLGFQPKGQEIGITFGEPATLGTIIDGEERSPVCITEVLQARYQDEFNSL